MQGLKNAIVDEMARRADAIGFVFYLGRRGVANNSVPTRYYTSIVFGVGGGEETGKLRELMLDLFVWYEDCYASLLGCIP